MAFHYTLIRQETEPARPQPGFFWLKQSIGQLFFAVVGEWIPLVAGSPTADPDNVYWYEIKQQTGEPANPGAGQIWLNTNTKQEYVYIAGWLPLL